MFGQILVDVGMVGVIALILFISVKQGFVKSFFKLTKIIFVIALTVALSSFFVEVCKDLFVRDMFEGQISASLVEKAQNSAETFDFDAMASALPEALVNILPMDSIESYFESLSGSGTEVAYAIGTEIEGFLINLVAKVVAYIGTFILSYIVCSIAVFLLDKFCKISFLDKLNKVFGFIWGLAHSYVFVSVAVCIVMLIFGGEFVEKTFITKLIYKYGLFTH